MKKLQGLTADYSHMIASEERAKLMQGQLRETEEHIELKMHQLEQKSAKQKIELD